jgi:xanthine/CO dehydrogenase XdhC/CoxF family maturation factor
MRHVTVYEVSKPAPREPRHIIMSAEGREIRGVVSIGMTKEAIYARHSGPVQCTLEFELGKSEPVIAKFIHESACAT